MQNILAMTFGLTYESRKWIDEWMNECVHNNPSFRSSGNKMFDVRRIYFIWNRRISLACHRRNINMNMVPIIIYYLFVTETKYGYEKFQCCRYSFQSSSLNWLNRIHEIEYYYDLEMQLICCMRQRITQKLGQFLKIYLMHWMPYNMQHCSWDSF